MNERRAKGLYWDAAWKLVEGCTKVSPGCDNCWSEAETVMRSDHPNRKISDRASEVLCDELGPIGFGGNILCREDNLDLPLRTRKPTVFSIWNDLFHEDVPGEFRANAFQTMERARKLGHTFLVLTKRAEAMANLLEDIGVESPDHIWWGVTAENQEQADARIPHLLRVPGKRFLSVEPMLGPVDLGNIFAGGCGDCDRCLGLPGMIPNPRQCHSPEYFSAMHDVQAVLCGGESGRNARPMHPDWVRSLRDQCAAAGVPFMFKQWGEWCPAESRMESSTLQNGDAAHQGHGDPKGYWFDDGTYTERTGKKTAGRILDGRTHDDLPWDSTWEK